MSDKTPLNTLINDLYRDGNPDLSWVVEHAPDGDLAAAIGRLWETDSGTERAELLVWLDPRSAVSAPFLEILRRAVALAIRDAKPDVRAELERCTQTLADPPRTVDLDDMPYFPYRDSLARPRKWTIPRHFQNEVIGAVRSTCTAIGKNPSHMAWASMEFHRAGAFAPTKYRDRWPRALMSRAEVEAYARARWPR
jgi:hypothetical protein